MLKLYNSLTRKIEVFKPLHPPGVGVYTCGPTVYDYVHIGNWRTYFLGDLLIRVLKYCGYNVTYVMNITDVGHLTGDNLGDADLGEDRVEKAARRKKKTVWEIADFFLKDFKQGYRKLHLIKPLIFCRATDHIKEQIEMVQTLEKKGFTYRINDGIYFNVRAFEKAGNVYGKLSTLDRIKAGARVKVNPEKKDPRDFALWKLSQDSPGTKRGMEWSSPWGVGFPGWHIECSAMSMKYLGQQFEIHVGGEDLRSTHHPNETAQSEATSGKKPFVKYWLHGAFLKVDGGRMGKSLGNVYTLHDLEKKGFQPEHLRYFYLTGHYRQPLNFTWEGLQKARTSYQRLLEKFWEFSSQREFDKGNASKCGKQAQAYQQSFLQALEDDLQLPEALAVVWKMVRSGLTSKEKIFLLREWDKILGFQLRKKKKPVRVKVFDKVEMTTQAGVRLTDDLRELVRKREEVRQQQNWQAADKLRKKIESLGYIIKDTKSGPEIKER